MFLAGEEFADQHDLFDSRGNVTQNGGKQIDPVNYDRFIAVASNDKNGNPDGYYAPMRREIHDYVRNLIWLRRSTPALCADDTSFIWVDLNDGKQVIAWQRGEAGDPGTAIVLANFSDFESASGADYVVSTWPGPAAAGRKWRDVSQGRDVDPAWVGREAIFPWEAKVYMQVEA
jgi:pullulanase